MTVSNTGSQDGDEVVFAYLTNETSVKIDTPMPFKHLVDFKRIHVKAGAKEQITLNFQPERLALVDSKGEKATYPGDYTLRIDRGHGDAINVPLTIAGDKTVHFSLKKWWGEESMLI